MTRLPQTATHISRPIAPALILALQLLLCTLLQAQGVAQAEYPYKRDIEKGKYDKVLGKLQRRLSRDTANLECHYAAYRLYSDTAFPRHSSDTAYAHLVRVRNLFASAQQKQLDRWARDSYSGALFDYDLQRVCRMAMQQAHASHTLDAYRHFLDYYTLAPPDQRDSITDSRDTLEFAQTRALGTFEMLQDFIRRRPQSKVLPDAVRLRDSIAFAQADSKHTTAAYDNFRLSYPESHLFSRATDSVHLLEYRHALHYNAEQYYRGYVARYPESPYSPHCIHLADSIEYYRSIDSSDWHSYLLYLDAHNQNTAWTTHALHSLARFALHHQHLAAADQAVRRMPVGAPLRQPLALMLHQAYLHPSIRNFSRFYSRYPNLMDPLQRKRDSLALQLYEHYDYRMADSCIRVLAPGREAFLILQQILKDDIDHHRWHAAVSTLNRYAAHFGADYDYRQLLATLQADDPGPHKATPLSNAVNTPKGNEYAPVITSDGTTLYFAAKDRPDNIGGEDVFVTHFKNGKWSPATIEMDLSHTYGNEAPVSVTTDGNTLLLFQNGILYQADRTIGGWHTRRLPDIINSSTWQADATIAANRRIILWAAAGRTDREADSSVNLYASLLDSNGRWSEPFELGPSINTPFDERSPLLHPDMHTLYFCSEGHGSLGQMDLYMSTRLSDDSWTQWSTPINIGKTFNTTGDDWGYKITTDGTKAYHAKADRTQNIHTVPIPKNMRPRPVTVVTGTVTDRVGRPVSTQIYWENLATGQPLGQCSTDPATGRYHIVVPRGIDYGFFVHDSIYFPASFRLNLSLPSPDSNTAITTSTFNLQLVTYLQMTDDGLAQTLNNVFFNTSDWHIAPESHAELQRLAAIVKQMHLNVEITCHTDGQPGDTENSTLTQRRAEQLGMYLIELGCRPSAVNAKGMGSEHPASKRGSLHRSNRRIEVRLTR